MNKKQKQGWIAAGVAAVVGAGAYFLFRKKAKAAGGPELPPGDDDDVVDVDDPLPPPPAGGTPSIKRPSGDPPPGGCRDGWYDTTFWDAGTPEDARQRIVDVFHQIGYSFLGTTKTDGTFKRSGTAKQFQEDYNLVSRSGEFRPNMGGVAMDGLVGPCTLTALSYVLTAPGEKGPYNFATIARAERERLGLPTG